MQAYAMSMQDTMQTYTHPDLPMQAMQANT